MPSLKISLRRREFFIASAASIAAWPFTGHAQKAKRVRRVGVLLPAAREDSEYPSLLNAFVQALQQLGWTDASNLQFDIR